MPSPVTKGRNGVIEGPNSPQFEDSSTGYRMVRVFSGPWAAVNAAKPERLATMTGSGTFQVDIVQINRAPGDQAEMTVTLVEAAVPYNAEIYEIEWLELPQKLESHPRYSIGGVKELTNAMLDALEEWRSLSGATTRASKFSSLAPNAQDFAQKVMRGTDSYVLYSPVGRITNRSRLKPATGRCGTKNVPPSDITVPGYVYLKTADRATRHEGWWERVQEWTGALSVDEDLYPAG